MVAVQHTGVKAETGIKGEANPENFAERLPVIKPDVRSQRQPIATRRSRAAEEAICIKLEPATPPIKQEAGTLDTLHTNKRRRLKAEAQVELEGLKFTSEAPTVPSGPFPHLLRPTPEECRVSVLLSLFNVMEIQLGDKCFPTGPGGDDDASLSCCTCGVRDQAARDALARLHGEPQKHKEVEPALAATAAESLHTHSQKTVLDSLVGFGLLSRSMLFGGLPPFC
jgi:hypothetical protein